MPPGPEFVEALLRTWDSGDAVLPIDCRLPPAAQQNLAAHLRVGDPVEPGDAVVIATSGTTGDPKGAVLSHDAVKASALMTSAALKTTESDHWLSCLPPAHIGGLSVVMRALLTGTQLTVLPKFDADAVARSQATLISVVPTLLSRFDSSRFRRVLLGGAAPPASLPENVITTYGATETGSGVVYNRRPLDRVAIRTDANGQLWVNSPTLLRCYRDGDDPKVGGWYPTGDAGATHDDGTISVFGRIAEVINTGGEKVWPVAIERILDQHPSIAASRVFGVADPEWGQRVVAELELTPGMAAPSIDELKELVREKLAAYAAPKEVRIADRLERTTSGKVKRLPT